MYLTRAGSCKIRAFNDTRKLGGVKIPKGVNFHGGVYTKSAPNIKDEPTKVVCHFQISKIAMTRCGGFPRQNGRVHGYLTVYTDSIGKFQ